MISKGRYKEYADDVEKYTRAIDTRESLEAKGKVKKLVFTRLMWQESLLWFSFVQFLFIFLGLMDDVINNINTGISSLYGFLGFDNPFQFPVNMASFIAIGMIIFFFCFGFVGYRYLRTPQTTSMISMRNSGGHFMMYDIWKDIKEGVEELKEEVEELKKKD